MPPTAPLKRASLGDERRIQPAGREIAAGLGKRRIAIDEATAIVVAGLTNPRSQRLTNSFDGAARVVYRRVWHFYDESSRRRRPHGAERS